MFGLPVGLLIRIGAVLAVAAALWFGWHELTGHYIAIGEARRQVLWDADTVRRTKAMTDMTNLWNAKRQQAEQLEQERDDERKKRNDEASTQAKALPPAVAGVHVSGLAIRVLNDAIDNTTAVTGTSIHAAKEASAAPADSTVGYLTQWGVACIAAYEEARAMVSGWQEFYQALRSAQPKGALQ